MRPDEGGAKPFTYWTVTRGQATPTEGGIIEEARLSVFVNGQELATLMCSALDQEALALGFLYNEGVIDGLAEVGLVQANPARTSIDVLLHRADFSPPRRMVLTSGCGGGVTFQDIAAEHPPLDSAFVTTPEIIQARMRDLHASARLYREVRGVHSAILADESGLRLSAEDIGRHNTVDKLAGKALMAGLDATDHMLLSSGRVSSEMLSKARRMGVPLLVSRTGPTSTAVQLAQAWGICIVGYARRDSLRVYTHPARLGLHDLAPENDF
jgi:FdhD protein